MLYGRQKTTGLMLWKQYSNRTIFRETIYNRTNLRQNKHIITLEGLFLTSNIDPIITMQSNLEKKENNKKEYQENFYVQNNFASQASYSNFTKDNSLMTETLLKIIKSCRSMDEKQFRINYKTDDSARSSVFICIQLTTDTP